MDRSASGIDFAAIGHQDTWKNISSFVNGIRSVEQEKLSMEKIKNIFSFIPARDIFRVKVRSTNSSEINGVYIETFIDPDKLGSTFVRTNISKVTDAINHSIKLGAKIVALGGFTSIVLEGNTDSIETGKTKFTTGNSLTAAFIVKGIEIAAINRNINLNDSKVLIIGATGDIGMACVSYLKPKVKKLLLCARNNHRLKALSKQLLLEKISVDSSISLEGLLPEADIILCVASSAGLQFANCKKNVLICDAGYPKNLESSMERGNHFIFHGGMGRIAKGYEFTPDYSKTIYNYPAPGIIHGCLLEAMVLAFENKIENFSSGKGNITIDSMEEIYGLGLKHGITIAPFYNSNGLCFK